MTEQTQAPTRGSPEYDAAMAAKYREAKGEAPAPGNEIERAANAPAAPAAAPEGVPAKFIKDGQVDVAALAASYAALEKRLSGAPAAPAAPPAALPGDQPAAAQTPEEQAQGTVQAAGLDWDTLSAKAAKGEGFSAEEYAALEKVGMPRHVADGIAKVLTDRAAAEKTAAVEYAGGQKEADALLVWAAGNLSDAEKERINGLLASPDWRLGIDALKQRRGAASPTAGEPTLTTGGNQPGAPPGYRSRAEMKADMASPTYKTDPAFRERVALKMRFATWDLDGR